MPMFTLEKARFFMEEFALQTMSDPVAVDGLEDVFSKDSPGQAAPEARTVQDQTGNVSGSVQDCPHLLVNPISVDEAARILGISSNAICKRLRKGSLVGKKIQGKFKEEWLVEGAGLIEVLNVDVSTVQDSPSETNSGEGSVQDQTTHESRSGQERPDASLARLLDLVEKQAAKLEAASGQIGYLQAQLESQTKLIEMKDTQLKLLTDSQHRHGWWARFASWFVTGR